MESQFEILNLGDMFPIAVEMAVPKPKIEFQCDPQKEAEDPPPTPVIGHGDSAPEPLPPTEIAETAAPEEEADQGGSPVGTEGSVSEGAELSVGHENAPEPEPETDEVMEAAPEEWLSLVDELGWPSSDEETPVEETSKTEEEPVAEEEAVESDKESAEEEAIESDKESAEEEAVELNEVVAEEEEEEEEADESGKESAEEDVVVSEEELVLVKDELVEEKSGATAVLETAAVLQVPPENGRPPAAETTLPEYVEEGVLEREGLRSAESKTETASEERRSKKRQPIEFAVEVEPRKPVPRKKKIDMGKIFAKIKKPEAQTHPVVTERVQELSKPSKQSKQSIVEEVFRNLRKDPTETFDDADSEDVSGSDSSFDLLNFYSDNPSDGPYTTLEIQLKYTDKLIRRTHPLIWPS